jgi:hypothetical protein
VPSWPSKRGRGTEVLGTSEDQKVRGRGVLTPAGGSVDESRQPTRIGPPTNDCSGIPTVQAVVGAFVDRTGRRIGRVALAEGAKRPDKPFPGVSQLKVEAEGRGRGPFFIEGDIELPAPRKLGAVRSGRLAPSPEEHRFSALDLSAGALGLETGPRVSVQALDLLCPLLVFEDQWGRSGLFPSFGHVSTIRPAGTPLPARTSAGAKGDKGAASPPRRAARRPPSGV